MPSALPCVRTRKMMLSMLLIIPSSPAFKEPLLTSCSAASFSLSQGFFFSTFFQSHLLELIVQLLSVLIKPSLSALYNTIFGSAA